MKDQGFASSEFTLFSKSCTNGEMQAIIRTQLASHLKQAHQTISEEREKIKPLKTEEIAAVLNNQDSLKNLRLVQARKPLEKHLGKPVNERYRLAKERLLQTQKKLPSMHMRSKAGSRCGTVSFNDTAVYDS